MGSLIQTIDLPVNYFRPSDSVPEGFDIFTMEINMTLKATGMNISFHEQDGVIIRHFAGKVYLPDMVESWHLLFEKYNNLKDYRGILTSFLDAEIILQDRNMGDLIDFLKDHMDRIQDMKIAIVMDTPMVTNTIILAKRMKSLQIKPFTTIEAAMSWLRA